MRCDSIPVRGFDLCYDNVAVGFSSEVNKEIEPSVTNAARSIRRAKCEEPGALCFDRACGRAKPVKLDPIMEILASSEDVWLHDEPVSCCLSRRRLALYSPAQGYYP